MGTSGILLTGRIHMLPALVPPVPERHSLSLYLLSDSERPQRVLQTDPHSFTYFHHITSAMYFLFCSSLSSRTHTVAISRTHRIVLVTGQVAVSMLLSLYSQPLMPPGSRSEGYTKSHFSLHPAFPAPPKQTPSSHIYCGAP